MKIHFYSGVSQNGHLYSRLAHKNFSMKAILGKLFSQKLLKKTNDIKTQSLFKYFVFKILFYDSFLDLLLKNFVGQLYFIFQFIDD